MSAGAEPSAAGRPAGRMGLAIACALLWAAAATSARWIGAWPALGGAAVVLGLTVVVFDARAAGRLLRPRLGLVLTGAAVGGLMTAATYLFDPPLLRAWPAAAADTVRLYTAFRAPSMVLATLSLPVVIIGEELVWRGAVQTALVERLGPRAGVPVTALVYALAHAPLGYPVLVLVAFLCGLVWGRLRLTSDSLVAPLSAHLLWDAFVLLWFPLA